MHFCHLFSSGQAPPDSFWFNLALGETEGGKTKSLTVWMRIQPGLFCLAPHSYNPNTQRKARAVIEQIICIPSSASRRLITPLYKSTCGILSFRLRCSDAGVNAGLMTTQKYYSLPEEEFTAKIIGFVFVYVTALQ